MILSAISICSWKCCWAKCNLHSTFLFSTKLGNLKRGSEMICLHTGSVWCQSASRSNRLRSHIERYMAVRRHISIPPVSSLQPGRHSADSLRSVVPRTHLLTIGDCTFPMHGWCPHFERSAGLRHLIPFPSASSAPASKLINLVFHSVVVHSYWLSFSCHSAACLYP